MSLTGADSTIICYYKTTLQQLQIRVRWTLVIFAILQRKKYALQIDFVGFDKPVVDASGAGPVY